MTRYDIPGLDPRPDWWQVRPDEITAAVQAVRQGETEQIATTPGGLPVWRVAFGHERARAGTANWPSAASSGDPSAYRTDDERQVVMLLCGVHGAEAEAVAGAVNLISLLDTGTDLRGQARPSLVDLCRQYRLVIVPCANMDGRSVSPDHLRGATMDRFVRASQGVWEDGTPIGYPACKKYAPLPLQRVAHLGGYPNADGFNIQHDAAPGNLCTAEAKGMLKLAAAEQVDLVLNLHSHSMGARLLGQGLMCTPLHHARTAAYQQRIHDALDEAGLRPAPVMNPGKGGFSINGAMAMATGALVMTFENPTGAEWSFVELLEHTYVVLECCLQWGLKEPFAPRDEVRRDVVAGK